jgi:hypothetical protein
MDGPQQLTTHELAFINSFALRTPINLTTIIYQLLFPTLTTNIYQLIN